jgi:hypothetical protein
MQMDVVGPKADAVAFEEDHYAMAYSKGVAKRFSLAAEVAVRALLSVARMQKRKTQPEPGEPPTTLMFFSMSDAKAPAKTPGCAPLRLHVARHLDKRDAVNRSLESAGEAI